MASRGSRVVSKSTESWWAMPDMISLVRRSRSRARISRLAAESPRLNAESNEPRHGPGARLPAVDGAATRLIHATGEFVHRPRIQIAAVTGYGQATDRIRAVESGFDAHLVKPIAPVAGVAGEPSWGQAGRTLRPAARLPRLTKAASP